jgi:hypothetical protein
MPIRPVLTSHRHVTTWIARGLTGLALLLLVAGCGSDRTPGGTQAEPGLVHVHAVALDPADPDNLYVATHTGLFHLDSKGSARRVGGHYHDLMGFTVAGPGDFLASGHPDLQTTTLRAPGKPPLLGLVHSSDGGASWQPLSLLGEADFHSLQVTHGLVYGYDATGGRFMVSADRKTFQTRSTVELIDFAVSPQDPDLILASARKGLVRSSDGGRSWTPVSDAGYVVLDWAGTGLFGLAADGTAGAPGNPAGTSAGNPKRYSHATTYSSQLLLIRAFSNPEMVAAPGHCALLLARLAAMPPEKASLSG